MKTLAHLAILIAVMLPATALAQSPPPSAPAAPDAALTARLSAFLTDVLAGHLPATGVSDKMKAAFTPDVIAKVDAELSPLGAFQTLKFVSQDTAQGFKRYHYNAVFAKGEQPLLFVLDDAGNIAGFFSDTPAPTSMTTNAPDPALTARFNAFLTAVLAGHAPATGLSEKMKAAFTPDFIAQVDAGFAPLGTFKTLQFVSQDTVQGYKRYHYNGVFDKGTQPLMFVVDAAGNIAGFFAE
jgi:hypothetical protein